MLSVVILSCRREFRAGDIGVYHTVLSGIVACVRISEQDV